MADIYRGPHDGAISKKESLVPWLGLTCHQISLKSFINKTEILLSNRSEHISSLEDIKIDTFQIKSIKCH